MQKSLICKKMVFFLFLCCLSFCGCGQKDPYLPEAENDTIFTVIGE